MKVYLLVENIVKFCNLDTVMSVSGTVLQTKLQQQRDMVKTHSKLLYNISRYLYFPIETKQSL